MQKLEVFCDFWSARATLCGDRRAKTRGWFSCCFLVFFGAFLRRADEPSAGIGVVEVQKLVDFFAFLRRA